jgi:ribulose 1,5-bisphosphate carboxylase large subunit-like protein
VGRLGVSLHGYVIRRGPGVVVHRAGGSVVAVTVRDAEEAAAAANALRERSRVQQEG